MFNYDYNIKKMNLNLSMKCINMLNYPQNGSKKFPKKT